MLHRLSPRDRTTLVVWFLVALLGRGVVIWGLAPNLQADTDGYRELAENLRNEGVYGSSRSGQLKPTAFRPPLYPLLLTLTVSGGQVSLALVAVIQVALGALTVAVLWGVARRVGLGWGAHAAALVVAVDPILLMQSSQLMTETLAAFFVAAVIWALVEAYEQSSTLLWLLCGALLGAACLCRPTFLVSSAFIMLAVVATDWLAKRAQAKGNSTKRKRSRRDADERQEAKSSLWPVLLLVLAAAPLPLAWTLRNALVMGRPIVATTHGGYTLLLGNNPDFYRHLESGDAPVWQADSLDQTISQLRRERGWSELDYDRWAGREAKQAIRNDFGGFVRSCLHRVRRLWGVLPRQTVAEESGKRRASRYAVAVWYVVLFCSALWGLFSRRVRLPRMAWIGAGAFAASFTLLHTLYWCDMRMRGPLAPVIAIVACAALTPRRDQR